VARVNKDKEIAMTNLKVVSPTGCVHAVAGTRGRKYGVKCNHKDYFLDYLDEGYYHGWDLTDKPVTCKRCLRLLDPSRKSLSEIRGQALEDIRDLAIGYDGFSTTEGLRSLIDDMQNIAAKALNNEQWYTHISPPSRKDEIQL